MFRASPLLLALLLPLAACDKAQSTECPDTDGQPVAQTTPSDGGGAPALAVVAATAAKAQGVDKVELRLAADGTVLKQAVYHMDAALIPEAVKATAESTFPGAEITHYETERYADLGDIHEVEMKTAEGKECEVAAKPDGTLLYTECSEDPQSAPEAIQAAVEAAVPGATIKEYEVKKGEGIDEVTAEVEANGQEYYLHFKPDGTLTDKRMRVSAIIEVPMD